MTVLTGLVDLVTAAAQYGLDNAVAIVIGCMLGPVLIKPGAGLVSDILARASEFVAGITKAVTK